MKHRHIVLILNVWLAIAAGCGDTSKKESRLVERVLAPEPILTSTSAPRAPDPVGAIEEPIAKPTKMDLVTDEKPDAPTFEPVFASAGELRLQRFVTAMQIEKREPVETTPIFGDQDERVYAFLEVTNDSPFDETLLVYFIGPKGEVSGGIELQIPASAPRWRTWAYTRNARAPGLWRVEIRDLEGKLVGALPFEVEPGC